MDKTTILMLATPVIALQFGLQITALVNLFRKKSMKIENKLIWALVILLTGVVGSIVYFVFGKDK